MADVFADAAYWIAVSLVNDQWHQTAVEARQRVAGEALVTTDEVLTEFLAAMSRRGGPERTAAANAVHDILRNPGIRVIPQTRESFLHGLDRYERRPDKAYSLQDCISMNIMEAEGITEILTSDHNFEQEGFTILMKRDP